VNGFGIVHAVPPTVLPAKLPNDIEVLRQMVLQRDALLAERDAQAQAREAVVARKSAEALLLQTLIEKLKLQIARLKRQKFGASSEKGDGQLAQLELLVEELETSQAQQAVPTAAATGDQTPPEPGKPARKPLPEHLPRETQVHQGECGCPRCGSWQLEQIGQDVSEQLELVPERFKVIRHVRPKFKCGACAAITQAPAASRPIARGVAGAGLLAHVLVSKYADHLPLYRQSQIYQRQGVELERSTLAGWVGECAALLDPLAAVLGKHVKAAAKVHADDTPVKVLRPGHGKTQIARLWAYVRDDRPMGDAAPPAVWFQYSPDRKGIRVQQHLADFKGILQADGYAGYEPLYARGQASEAACWAHARRKFFELKDAGPSPAANQALQRIAQLYAIEARIRGRPPDERQATRQAEAVALLASFKAWLEATLAQASSKSPLAQAIRYSLTRWQALTRYASDGRIEIDNNAVEREIRADGAQELPVHGFGRRGRARRRDLQPAEYSQAQWRRSRGLPAPCACAHRRPSSEPGRRAAAVERGD
jgi:transposase